MILQWIIAWPLSGAACEACSAGRSLILVIAD
jgi:hypothetical protein